MGSGALALQLALRVGIVVRQQNSRDVRPRLHTRALGGDMPRTDPFEHFRACASSPRRVSSGMRAFFVAGIAGEVLGHNCLPTRPEWARVVLVPATTRR